MTFGRLVSYGLAGGIVALLGFAQPARACFVVPITYVGTAPERLSPRQILAADRRWSKIATRQRLVAGKARLREGRVDVAAELAELLVPNPRPIFIPESNCGPHGEIDFAAGRERIQDEFASLVKGTPLAGSDWSDFAGLLRASDTSLAFGAGCNGEFRRTFAAFLSAEVNDADLRDAWLFLGARQRADYDRLTVFDGRTRHPPVRWLLSNPRLKDEVRRYVRKRAAGRSIEAATDKFWAINGPLLDDDNHVCPNFNADWLKRRELLLAQILEKHEERRRRRAR